MTRFFNGVVVSRCLLISMNVGKTKVNNSQLKKKNLKERSIK